MLTINQSPFFIINISFLLLLFISTIFNLVDATSASLPQFTFSADDAVISTPGNPKLTSSADCYNVGNCLAYWSVNGVAYFTIPSTAMSSIVDNNTITLLYAKAVAAGYPPDQSMRVEILASDGATVEDTFVFSPPRTTLIHQRGWEVSRKITLPVGFTLGPNKRILFHATVGDSFVWNLISVFINDPVSPTFDKVEVASTLDPLLPAGPTFSRRFTASDKESKNQKGFLQLNAQDVYRLGGSGTRLGEDSYDSETLIIGWWSGGDGFATFLIPDNWVGFFNYNQTAPSSICSCNSSTNNNNNTSTPTPPPSSVKVRIIFQFAKDRSGGRGNLRAHLISADEKQHQISLPFSPVVTGGWLSDKTQLMELPDTFDLTPNATLNISSDAPSGFGAWNIFNVFMVPVDGGSLPLATNNNSSQFSKLLSDASMLKNHYEEQLRHQLLSTVIPLTITNVIFFVGFVFCWRQSYSRGARLEEAVEKLKKEVDAVAAVTTTAATLSPAPYRLGTGGAGICDADIAAFVRAIRADDDPGQVVRVPSGVMFGGGSEMVQVNEQ